MIRDLYKDGVFENEDFKAALFVIAQKICYDRGKCLTKDVST